MDGVPVGLQPMGLQKSGHDLMTEQQQQLIYNIVLVSGG